jgi:hypothetical protein
MNNDTAGDDDYTDGDVDWIDSVVVDDDDNDDECIILMMTITLFQCKFI